MGQRDEMLAGGFNPDFQGRSFSVHSQQKGVPVDDDGLPFMNHRDLGAIMARSEHDSKRLAWETGINQHIEYQGQGDKHRVWFSTRDVQQHINSLQTGKHPATANMSKQERDMRWGQHNTDLKRKLSNAQAARQSSIKNGNAVFDTHNQPDRGNAGFENRTFRGPRIFTDSTGDTIPTHDLKTAIKQGNFRSIKRGGM